MTLNVCSILGVTWSKSVTNLSRIEQSTAELLMIYQILAVLHHVVTLTFDPLDLKHLQYIACHMFKLCTKLEWNRTICSWVIEDFSKFFWPFFYGGDVIDRWSQSWGAIYVKFGMEVGQLYVLPTRLSGLWCFASFWSYRASESKIRPNFEIFAPLKIGQGWLKCVGRNEARSSSLRVEVLGFQ